jgi:hypothetical protein
MARPKKLADISSQIHGKIETFQPSTLEQILGGSGTGKYGTLDEGEYQQQLNNMQKVDLQAHATQIGIIPIDDRERLVKRLLSEFRMHVGAYKRPQASGKTAQAIPPEIAKILAEGR